VKALWAAFPDTNWAIDEIFSGEDSVYARLAYTGTHTGEFQGMPPTGNKTGVAVSWKARIENGKLVEVREDVDMLNWMQQLGMELKPKE
jgi:predicted ester cyclase